MIEISVLMAVYKEPIEWVRESVDSILNQTFQNYEFLICLDNPDYSEMYNYLRGLEKTNQKIRVFCNEKNVGLTKSLNILLLESRGKYIARMDADDISFKRRFELQYRFMESNPEISVLGTAIKRFGEIEKVVEFESDPLSIWENFTYHNPFLSPVAHPTAFIRKDILVRNNIKYNENYTTAQDYALWNEVLKFGKISNLSDILLKYRESENQISKKKKANQSSVVLDVIYDHANHFVNSNNIILPKKELSVEYILETASKHDDKFIKTKLYKVAYGLIYFDNSASLWHLVKFSLFHRDVAITTNDLKRILKKRIKDKLSKFI